MIRAITTGQNRGRRTVRCTALLNYSVVTVISFSSFHTAGHYSNFSLHLSGPFLIVRMRTTFSVITINLNDLARNGVLVYAFPFLSIKANSVITGEPVARIVIFIRTH